MKYRKKPIVVDAVSYDGNFRCLDIFPFSEVRGIIVSQKENGKACLKIETLEGTMTVSQGDWVVRGIKGEYYPVRDDIFHLTYEPADPEQPITK